MAVRRLSEYAERARNYYLETGTRFPRELKMAKGLIKALGGRANMDLGLLSGDVGSAIVRASLELASGAYDGLIVVDVFQTGSGTGLNMNVNEVIASVASKYCGCKVHPNDHVNMGQSSNDVVPTAVRVAAYKAIRDELLPAARALAEDLKLRASEYKDFVKPGRTHLRDALPVTFGQELEAYADAIDVDLRELSRASEELTYVPLGGTAVGTGLNSHPDMPRLALSYLSSYVGFEVRRANSFRAMRSLSDVAAASGALRSLALDLLRVSQDLRLMNSGPNTGLAEVVIPEEIAGSSIMPGKENPVTLEAVMQAVAQVIGLDHAVSWAASLGELELNMGIPLMGYDVQLEVLLLSEAARKLDAMVVKRLRANQERMRRLAEVSQALVTVLSPIVGYDEATRIAHEVEGGLSLEEAARRRGLSDDVISAIRDLRSLTSPGVPARQRKPG